MRGWIKISGGFISSLPRDVFPSLIQTVLQPVYYNSRVLQPVYYSSTVLQPVNNSSTVLQTVYYSSTVLISAYYRAGSVSFVHFVFCT